MAKKPIYLWIAGIVFLTGLMIYFGFDQIMIVFREANLLVIVGLCALQVWTLFSNAYQYHYIINKQHDLPFSKTFPIFLSGDFVESVTPAEKIGGEATKVYLFRKNTSLSYQQLTGILFTQKFVSLLPFVLLVAAVIPFTALRYGLPIFVYLSFFALIALLIFLIWFMSSKFPEAGNPKSFTDDNKSGILKFVQKFWNFLKESSFHARKLTNRKDKVILIIISLAVWIIYPTKIWIISAMLGFEIGFFAAAVSTYVAYLISMIPLTPGGLGSFEATMAITFSIFGLTAGEGFSIAIMSRFITYWFPLALSAGVATFYLKSIKLI